MEPLSPDRTHDLMTIFGTVKEVPIETPPITMLLLSGASVTPALLREMPSSVVLMAYLPPPVLVSLL